MSCPFYFLKKWGGEGIIPSNNDQIFHLYLYLKKERKKEINVMLLNSIPLLYIYFSFFVEIVLYYLPI